MLTQLQIRDFAIIEAAELELRQGLTALTGETGAGKSILVDAVMLAIGARADAGVIRHGAERTEISAVFDLSGNEAARSWLREQELDDDEVILRRTIGSDGRSRAYINGQTQPLAQVRALGELLIDIHGQQEFLTLTRRDAQRDLLDAHGGHEALIAPVAASARLLRNLERDLSALKLAASERDVRRDDADAEVVDERQLHHLGQGPDGHVARQHEPRGQHGQQRDDLEQLGFDFGPQVPQKDNSSNANTLRVTAVPTMQSIPTATRSSGSARASPRRSTT